MVEVQRVDIKARSAGAAESGSNFGTDVATLSHTCYENFAFTVKNKIDSFVEIGVELWNKVKQCLGLIFETLDSSIVPHDFFCLVGI